MSKRYTFSKFLRNDKLMILVSLLVAIVIWVVVLTGPMNVVDRVIGTTVTVNLGNSYAGLSGLRIIGDAKTDANVTIEGAWSVISRLTAQDLRVVADLSAITGPGDFNLPILASRNSAETNYDITNISPSTITVHCDYWQEGTIFEVECDTSALKVTDPNTMQIGEPVVDQTSFSNGMITIEGPKSTISQINRVVARLTSVVPLDSNKLFEVPLTALDAKGEAVDLTHCTILEVPAGLIRVTVPIWEARQIALGAAAVNGPAGADDDAMLRVEPAEIRVLGSTAELDALEEQLKTVGSVDVTTLTVDEDSFEMLPLTLPPTVKSEDAPANVKVSLNPETVAQKTLTVEANASNVIIENAKRATVQSRIFEAITVIGAPESIEKLTDKDIVFTVTPESDGDSGQWLVPQISVKGYDDVWVFLSEDLTDEAVYVEQK